MPLLAAVYAHSREPVEVDNSIQYRVSAANAMLENGAEMVLRLVDSMESAKVSVVIVDPGWIELSVSRETVKDPPSLGLSARTKRPTEVKV